MSVRANKTSADKPGSQQKRKRSAAERLHALGLDRTTSAPAEKEKLSITLDKSLVADIRAHYGQRALSTSINDLLHVALAQDRLGQLVDQLQQEAGTPTPEAYERIMAVWLAAE